MTVGSFTFTTEDLANIRYSYTASNMGMSGIVTSQLTADCRADEETAAAIANGVPPGSAVTFLTSEFGYTLPDMVLGFVDIREGGLSITAYDKTVNADVEFTAAGTSFTEWADAAHTRKNLYHAVDILNAAAQKMGLGGAGNIPTLPDLYYNEFVGKSCRQIFEEASKVGGIWYAAQGSIVFSPFNASGSSFTPPAETDHTDIKYLGSKIISRAFVTDSYHNAVYEYGNASAAWYSTVTISGAYLLGSSMCAAAAGRVVGETYHAWKIDRMKMNGLISPGALYTQSSEKFPALELVIDFGATDITGSVGAPAVQQSFADYQSLTQRALENKIDYNMIVGVLKADKDGNLSITKRAADG